MEELSEGTQLGFLLQRGLEALLDTCLLDISTKWQLWAVCAGEFV